MKPNGYPYAGQENERFLTASEKVKRSTNKSPQRFPIPDLECSTWQFITQGENGWEEGLPGEAESPGFRVLSIAFAKPIVGIGFLSASIHSFDSGTNTPIDRNSVYDRFDPVAIPPGIS